MATLTVTKPGVVTANTPTANAVSAESDQFPADFGARYLLVINNGHASATPDITVQDPNTNAPAGRTFVNPTSATIVSALPVGAKRCAVLDAARFRNSSGNIVLEYSTDFTNSNSTIEVYRL